MQKQRNNRCICLKVQPNKLTCENLMWNFLRTKFKTLRKQENENMHFHHPVNSASRCMRCSLSGNYTLQISLLSHLLHCIWWSVNSFLCSPGEKLPVVLILLKNLIGWSQTSSACTLRLHRRSYIYVLILLILYVSSIFNKRGESPWMVVAMVKCGSLGRAALSINWWVSGMIPGSCSTGATYGSSMNMWICMWMNKVVLKMVKCFY